MVDVVGTRKEWEPSVQRLVAGCGHSSGVKVADWWQAPSTLHGVVGARPPSPETAIIAHIRRGYAYSREGHVHTTKYSTRLHVIVIVAPVLSD